MSQLRFKHVFYILMVLAAVLAFFVPAQTAGRIQPRIEMVFAPVSRPVAAIARSVTHRTSQATVTDLRADPEIRSENELLRSEVMQLNALVAELTRQNNELGKLGGDLKQMCVVTKVVGSDSGNRDSLSITGTTFGGIKEEMYVLYGDVLVGQVARAGAMGSQVRLITDPAFRIRVRFVHFDKEFPVQSAVGTVVVQGMGDGRMKATLSLADIGLDANLKSLDAKNGPNIREGDYIRIDDNECASALQGLTVGKVVRIQQLREGRLFAEVQIEPATNLQRLPEVMVMTKER